MNFGKKLINIRKENNLSQEKLAEKLDVTRQTISNWESNLTYPNMEQLKRISKLFNISIDNLMNNKEIYNDEKNVKKNHNLIKIMLGTIYIILLVSIITFIFYLINKRDFTKEYQTEFICETILNGEKIIEDVYAYNDNGNYYVVVGSEEFKAGETIFEVMESLNAIKKVVIDNGGKCY